MQHSIEYTPFVMRHFDKNFVGTNLSKFNQDDLLSFINDAYEDLFAIDFDETAIELQDTIFPFCKYLVIPLDDEFDIPCSVKKIEQSDYYFMRCDYSSRTPDELEVLSRWLEIPKMFPRPKSKYLVVILYSNQQLKDEFKPSETQPEYYLSDDVEYGIVSLMGTVEPTADPLVPITIMRNALGKEEGGNGVPIDHEVYKKSVEFWKNHIMIK